MGPSLSHHGHGLWYVQMSKRPKFKKTRKLSINGETYVPLVLYVTKRSPDGRPRELRTVYDEETHQMKSGDEFLVVFALESMLKPTAN